jgi:uncharacterized protein
MFDWDEANSQHLLRHGIEPGEAEEALLDPAGIGSSAHRLRGERRWAVLAATESVRVLVVIYTRRGEVIRVITAIDADPAERRRYRRRGK